MIGRCVRVKISFHLVIYYIDMKLNKDLWKSLPLQTKRKYKINTTSNKMALSKSKSNSGVSFFFFFFFTWK